MKIFAPFIHFFQQLSSWRKSHLFFSRGFRKNTGAHLIEWPSRADYAMEAIRQLSFTGPIRLGDYGCGRQTLRRVLSSDVIYIPIDHISRSSDTVLCDFNRELPPGGFDIGCCLGVLEYLNFPIQFLMKLFESNSFVIFTYNGPTTARRRRKQGWINNLRVVELEETIEASGSKLLYSEEMEKNERIYLVKGRRPR